VVWVRLPQKVVIGILVDPWEMKGKRILIKQFAQDEEQHVKRFWQIFFCRLIVNMATLRFIAIRGVNMLRSHPFLTVSILPTVAT
jgi:hypothetical protein